MMGNHCSAGFPLLQVMYQSDGETRVFTDLHLAASAGSGNQDHTGPAL